jgi:hypothetical protein
MKLRIGHPTIAGSELPWHLGPIFEFKVSNPLSGRCSLTPFGTTPRVIATIAPIPGACFGHGVEFLGLASETFSVATLPPDWVRPIGRRERAHVGAASSRSRAGGGWEVTPVRAQVGRASFASFSAGGPKRAGSVSSSRMSRALGFIRSPTPGRPNPFLTVREPRKPPPKRRRSCCRPR